MTEPEVAELLGILVAAYPNQQINPQTVSVYTMALADLDAGEALQAVRRILAESRFFPTIAEIRQDVTRARVALPSAEEAWGEVHRKIKDVGAYGDPEWSSPALQQTVRAIGWRELCLTELDDLNTTRAHFFRTFNAYRERTLRDENLASLESGPEPERLDGGYRGSPYESGFRKAGAIPALKDPRTGEVLEWLMPNGELK